MATLSKQFIEHYFKNPQNSIAIQQAALDNEHQLFHAMLSLRPADSNSYLQKLYLKVQGILNNDEKYQQFKKDLQFPLVSNALISKASDEWNKVFYAQDQNKEYKFTDESFSGDLDAYLLKIGFPNTLGQDLFTLVKQQVNTIAVVDIPAISQVDDALTLETQPYVYFLDTGKIHDVGVNQNGTIEYLIFKRLQSKVNPTDKDVYELVVIDDQHYRVLEIHDKDTLIDLIESPHGLNYCPATFIWSDFIDQKNKVRRFNTVLEIVEKLDRYLILTVFKEHADLYASYPIMFRYVDACEDIDDSEALKTGLLGPGHLVEITVPPQEGGAKMSPPVGFVDNDPRLLVYIEDKLRKLEVEITKHLTGVDNEIQNEKAFNESQIRSQYETRHSVLRYWAEQFQATERFLVETIARLIYGDVQSGGSFIAAIIDYGMDYFLYDTLTATNEYESAKAAGLPPHLLDLILNKVNQSYSRNNPTAAERIKIQNYLIPYIHESLDVINPASEDYELKANFRYYIDKFELEHETITKFGSLVNFSTKISAIRTIINSYVKEHRKQHPYLGELLPGQIQLTGSVQRPTVGSGSES